MSKYSTVHYRTHWYSVGLAQKSRALLYSDLVRQRNRHASSEPSCVNRHASTVTRQSMNWFLEFSFLFSCAADFGRHEREPAKSAPLPADPRARVRRRMWRARCSGASRAASRALRSCRSSFAPRLPGVPGPGPSPGQESVRLLLQYRVLRGSSAQAPTPARHPRYTYCLSRLPHLLLEMF